MTGCINVTSPQIHSLASHINSVCAQDLEFMIALDCLQHKYFTLLSLLSACFPWKFSKRERAREKRAQKFSQSHGKKFFFCRQAQSRDSAEAYSVVIFLSRKKEWEKINFLSIDELKIRKFPRQQQRKQKNHQFSVWSVACVTAWRKNLSRRTEKKKW